MRADSACDFGKFFLKIGISNHIAGEMALHILFLSEQFIEVYFLSSNSAVTEYAVAFDSEKLELGS